MSCDVRTTGSPAKLLSRSAEKTGRTCGCSAGEERSPASEMLLLDSFGDIVATSPGGADGFLFDGRRVRIGDRYVSALRVAGCSRQLALQFADAVELTLKGQLDSYAVATKESPDMPGDYELAVRRLAEGGAVQAVVERRTVSDDRTREAPVDRELLALVAELTDNAVIITDADG